MLGEVNLPDLRARRDAAYREYMQLQVRVEFAEAQESAKNQAAFAKWRDEQAAKSATQQSYFTSLTSQATPEQIVRELNRLKA